MRNGGWILLLSLLAAVTTTVAACGRHDVAVEYYGYRPFSSSEQRSIQRIADTAAIDVRNVLPALPRRLVLRVRTGTDVMPETGEGASALPPDMVIWTVDRMRTEGVQQIIERQLRGTLFHEFHHIVRFATGGPMTLMDHVISEGMATAFERDFGKTKPEWGQYPADVADWVGELVSGSKGASQNEWLFRHPDGRRWVGYRAGTFLVDQAMAESKQSSADMITMPTADVIALALRYQVGR